MGHLGHRHLMNPVDVSTELVDECEAFKDQLIAEYEVSKLIILICLGENP